MSAWEATGKSDDWYTPKYIFDAMGDVMFDLDVAAPKDGPRHVPCRSWLWEGSLVLDWWGNVWVNPPYGGRGALAPWLRKFVAHGDGIAIVPDRTSAPWFQEFAPRMHAVLFIAPKVKFERPDGSLGKSPGTGSALFAIGGNGVDRLRRAAALGWLVEPTRAA